MMQRFYYDSSFECEMPWESLTGQGPELAEVDEEY
jgi:hypothetical protein